MYNISRRNFLKYSASLMFSLLLLPKQSVAKIVHNLPLLFVNDTHTQLTPTYVHQILTPQSCQDIVHAILQAKNQNRSIAIAGARHSAGRQAFLTDGLLLDTRQLNRILSFTPESGIIEVESGCEWGKLIHYLIEAKENNRNLGIIQKPKGSDEITIGGSLGSNIHSRGLNFSPLISNIESFTLIDAEGTIKTCSRTENSNLFQLAIGGYGLFGFIYSVKIRLAERVRLSRRVDLMSINDVASFYYQSVQQGALYGDFEFSMAENSLDYMKNGFFVTYYPENTDTAIKSDAPDLPLVEENLNYLVHVNKEKAFDIYQDFHLKTANQLFWSDTHQLGTYKNNYHKDIDKRLNSKYPGTENIMEVFIPLNALASFFEIVRNDFLKHHIDLIYGTVRFIKKDTESFLPWAKNDFACVIFNLHTVHTSAGINQVKQAFQRLINRVIAYKGTYYLTYNAYASRQQVEACYPNFADFLKLKLKHDPTERFQSDWYQHYKKLFA
jgi:FAD/FMN-containing dehydrogenase